MRLLLPLAVVVAVVALAPAADEPPAKPTLFIVGDSTVKTGTKGQQGWGDPVIALFDKTKIAVQNHAIGGRSSRSSSPKGAGTRFSLPPSRATSC